MGSERMDLITRQGKRKEQRKRFAGEDTEVGDEMEKQANKDRVCCEGLEKPGGREGNSKSSKGRDRSNS